MFRTFELRLRANKAQATALTGVLTLSSELYNMALQERRDAWKIAHKRISYFDQTKELTQLRAEFREYGRLPVDVIREPLRRLDRAFKAFFRRCKAGQKPGYPRFRSRLRYDSFSTGDGFTIGARHLTIAKIGSFRFNSHRAIEGKPKQVTVKRRGKKWIARVTCEIGDAPPKMAISSAVGIDLGLTDFVTLSNGAAVPAPKFVKKHAQAIARAQRSLARKKRGSQNRLRAKEQARRAYQRMADARKTFVHHVSKALVDSYDLIAHEDLKIAQMVRGHFAKSILDAAWGMLIWQITYKAEKAGKWIVPVNPRGTTQRCSGCGATVPKTLAQRWHDCPACGLSLGRDHNAACEVLRLGRSRVDVLAEG